MREIWRRVAGRFPYKGAWDWAALCSLAFIAAQLLWYCSRFVRRIDALELPMAVLFFPPAFIMEPYDAMVNSRHILPYALAYWAWLYLFSLLVSRRRVHPALPAAAILVLSSAVALIYSIFFVYRGPMP